MKTKVVNVILESSDGERFTVDVEIAKQSVFIKKKLDSLGANEDKSQVISIEKVHGEILKKVIEWMTHHKDDDPAVQNNMPGSNKLSNWDAEFFNVDESTVYTLILAANDMNIDPLLHMSCQKAAELLMRKSVEEIRETLNIRNDFTPEEEEQVRRENEW